LSTIIKVIIPAYNEENSIGKVIDDIPPIVDEIIVVNNNSTDATERVAKTAGATVVNEPRRGYGHACLSYELYFITTNQARYHCLFRR